jgi:hypothetical protein
MNTLFFPPTASRSDPAMDAIADHRERRKLEEKERDWQRTQQFEELRSEFNSTAVRVRAWEKLHGLRLPTSSNHRALHVISAATGIPVASLRDEQHARREARTARPAAQVEVTNAPPADSSDGSAK